MLDDISLSARYLNDAGDEEQILSLDPRTASSLPFQAIIGFIVQHRFLLFCGHARGACTMKPSSPSGETLISTYPSTTGSDHLYFLG